MGNINKKLEEAGITSPQALSDSTTKYIEEVKNRLFDSSMQSDTKNTVAS